MPTRQMWSPALLTLQPYGHTSILGVQLIELARHVDESGSFTELMRLDEAGRLLDPRGLPVGIDDGDGQGFRARQLNWSELEPGIIRAFHVHKRQTDVWFVPAHEKVLVLLADLRQWPETPEPEYAAGNGVAKPVITQFQRVTLGDGRSRLLVIPPLVAHGFRTLTTEKTRLLYAVNTHFDPDPEHCDEWRLPWDLFGEGLWNAQHG